MEREFQRWTARRKVERLLQLIARSCSCWYAWRLMESDRRSSLLALALLGVSLLVVCRDSNALPGGLDPTFGVGGRVVTDFGERRGGIATGLVTQGDGKLVAAILGCPVLTGACPAAHLVLARYGPDGSLDSTFGMGGIAVTGLGESGYVIPSALVLQSDSKLVAAGLVEQPDDVRQDAVMVRFNPDGSPDATFGTDGVVTTEFFGDSGIHLRGSLDALVVQGDGKLVAVIGSVDRAGFWLVRYGPDGQRDATFGSGGIVTTDFGAGGSGSASALAVQADQKLVVAGTMRTGAASAFVLARYNVDGSRDATFGASGIVVTDFKTRDGGFDGGVSALVVQPDGKLVAGGSAVGTSRDFSRGADFALARYTPDGSLDSEFGVTGKVTTGFARGAGDYLHALALLPDGKLVAAGESDRVGSPFALAQYNSDGSLDALFGTGGRVTTDFPLDVPISHNDIARALAVQEDGRIVAAGFAEQSSGYPAVALARYEGASASPCPRGVPERIAKLFRRAMRILDLSATAAPRRAAKLQRKAKALLKAVKQVAKRAHPALTAACRIGIADAADAAQTEGGRSRSITSP